MIVRTTIIASTALLALAGCGRASDTTQTNTAMAEVTTANTAAATPAPVSASQTFVNAAAASDAFEIASSQLALANGASASVKSFARKMIEAHNASTAKLKATTGSLSPAITPDPALNPDQQQKLDAMKSLTGAEFDRAYIAAQTAGHQQTLDTLRAYAASGDTAALKSFATGLIPIVTAHLNMAKSLKA